jgi:FkbM family methyltransferase
LPIAFSIKHLAVRLFNALGLDVRRVHPATPPRAGMAGGLAQLARLGFQPRTVIDAGVANATPELYSTFPSASILLIEPLVEFEPFLRQICSMYKAQYVLAAAGSAPGSATFHVHADKFSSSLLQEVEGPGVDGAPRTVPVVSIDQLTAEKNLSGPFLIKLDVQGAELQVLAGAARTLRETEAVILEVTFFAAMIGGPLFFDVVSRMKDLGFVAYDVFGFQYRPLDGALNQLDMIFVREDGLFRRSHSFATPEQRQTQDREFNANLARKQKALR